MSSTLRCLIITSRFYEQSYSSMKNRSKLFIFYITSWRQYRPLVAVYFLTLPNTSPEQIWRYITVLYLSQFFLEIPSWYIGDTLWHKKTLIAGQICMGLWALSIAIWSTVIYFMVACFMIAVWKSFISWTIDAFFYEMLEEEWQEDKFGVMRSKFRWDSALLSMFLLIGYPFLSELSITLPFMFSFLLSFVWVIALYLLASPNSHHEIEEFLSIKQVIKKQGWTWFYLIAIFFGVIWSVYVIEANFREPYILEQGMSLWWIWIMIGGSRLVMYLLPKMNLFQKLWTIPLKKFFIIDGLIMCSSYIIWWISWNGYITLFIFMGMIWYRQSRKSFISNHLLSTVQNKHYKATVLSIYSQFQSIWWWLLWVLIWLLMGVWYTLWFITIWISLFILLLVYYLIFVHWSDKIS